MCASAPACAAEESTDESRALRVRFVPQLDAYQWGGDPLLVLRELRSLSSVMVVRVNDSALPTLMELSAEGAYFSWEIELTLLPDVDASTVREAFAFFDSVAEISIESAEPEQAAEQAVQRLAVSASRNTAPPRANANASDTTTIRVTTEKVDKVIDLMGELVIAQAVVRELVRSRASPDGMELQEAVLVAERHLRELQERVMSIRMVPVGAAFARLPRMVRDLAQKLGKSVRLELLGSDTELDKMLVDRVSDPLVHLVRNSLDHGIEQPAERQAGGKSPNARLQVRAYARGGSVFVEVADDGRGLDRDRIRLKAIERGLMGPDDVVGEEQLLKLICHPGFSTKQQVTEVSGRGVGLDVVQSTVDELGGELQVESTMGAGSCFRLRLPLTLTILEGLLLCAGREKCVMPLSDIAFSTQIKPGQARSLAGRGRVLDLGNEVLPLLELSAVLGQGPNVDETAPLAVVVQAGGYRYALRISGLLGQTQAVVKSLESHYRRVPGIMGATILGDGHVALILDGQGVATASGLQRGNRSDNSRAAQDQRSPGALA
jgi:two-component system chemotaxis sensor kinase CheA